VVDFVALSLEAKKLIATFADVVDVEVSSHSLDQVPSKYAIVIVADPSFVLVETSFPHPEMINIIKTIIMG
jgi:hypothetical protein